MNGGDHSVFAVVVHVSGRASCPIPNLGIKLGMYTAAPQTCEVPVLTVHDVCDIAEPSAR